MDPSFRIPSVSGAQWLATAGSNFGKKKAMGSQPEPAIWVTSIKIFLCYRCFYSNCIACFEAFIVYRRCLLEKFEFAVAPAMIRCWEVVVQKWPQKSYHLRCVASVAGSFRPTKVRAMNVPKEDLEISVGCFLGMGSQREPPKHGYFWGHIRRKLWKSNQNVDSSQESQRNKARERLRLHQKEGGSHLFSRKPWCDTPTCTFWSAPNVVVTVI